jgi:osmotically-inducible protein OsmY
MYRMFRIGISLGIAVFALGLAGDALAQSTADAKRTLKGQKLFYKVPGMIEVDVRAMRDTLMLTGSVPTEADMKKADEIAAEIRGVKEVRNRLRVREPDVAAGVVSDADLSAKIDKKIEEDQDLAKALAKEKFTYTITDGAVVIEGKLGDWSEAGSLINSVRRIPGIQTINFDKLKF